MNAGVNANHSRQEEGMKKKREKKKGSEKKGRWGGLEGGNGDPVQEEPLLFCRKPVCLITALLSGRGKDHFRGAIQKYILQYI